MTFMGKDEKNLLKDMKNQSNNWRDLLCVWTGRLNIISQFSSKIIYNSMQL